MTISQLYLSYNTLFLLRFSYKLVFPGVNQFEFGKNAIGVFSLVIPLTSGEKNEEQKDIFPSKQRRSF